MAALTPDAAAQAIQEPIEEEGAQIDADALAEIVGLTLDDPYFLKEWGKHTWAVAQGPRITFADVEQASDQARDALDRHFFRVRFDRLTPREQDYLHAMAQLGAGPRSTKSYPEGCSLVGSRHPRSLRSPLMS